MYCPRCFNVELAPRVVKDSDVILYCCPHCKGIWFHRGQMEAVMPKAIKDIHVPSDAALGSRPCPDCSEPMHVFYYPQTMVEIDMCSRCLGLWMDPGELREIQVIRKGLRLEAKEYDDIPGVKGRAIDFVNAALDWARGLSNE